MMDAGSDTPASRVDTGNAHDADDAPRAIGIGGVPLAVRLDDASMRARVAERYESFAREEAPRGAFRLDIRIDRDASPARLHPTWVDNPPLSAEGGLDRLVVSGDGFHATLDWSRGTGEGVVPDSLAHVDLLLRIALGVGLLREGGTLLHAAGVVRDGFGLAFPGPSGSGKSTLAGIASRAGMTVLADEMVVARPAGVGVRLAGTPFWHGAPGDAPFGGVFLIRHAPEPELEPIAPGAALAGLLRAGGAPVDTPEIQAAFFEALSGLLRRVPAYRLGFRPDDSVWRALDRRPEFAFWRPRRRLPPPVVRSLPSADRDARR